MLHAAPRPAYLAQLLVLGRLLNLTKQRPLQRLCQLRRRVDQALVDNQAGAGSRPGLRRAV